MLLPERQVAVRIVDKGQFIVDRDKPVDQIGPKQMLLEVEACGICFSDTKLLHAFDEHPRKTAVVGALTAEELAEIPSYRSDGLSTVPGHEPVGRIVQVGEDVRHFHRGDRVLVQADWKHLPTERSNSAFGYNFEGALQQYVLIDERCVIDEEGDSMLLPVGEAPSAASVGLIEPWATVESAYTGVNRRMPLIGGASLVVSNRAEASNIITSFLQESGVGNICWSDEDGVAALVSEKRIFDDIIYAGSDASCASALGALLGNHAMMNVVLGGERLSGEVGIDIGRIHYDGIRYCGTPGDNPSDGYAWIPENDHIQPGSRVAIIGAAGPMGIMHTVRALTLGLTDLRVVGTDIDDDRLARLKSIVQSATAESGSDFSAVNTRRDPLQSEYDYLVCMVPVQELVAQAVRLGVKNSVVNAFAGIPAGTVGPVDLQYVIENQVFLIGSSGSRTDDMATVLAKIESGIIDTTVVLDAVCGMAGFGEAIAAVAQRTSGGKIMVYPQLVDLPLIPLHELREKLPSVWEKLDGGKWTVAAEHELLSQRNAPVT